MYVVGWENLRCFPPTSYLRNRQGLNNDGERVRNSMNKSTGEKVVGASGDSEEHSGLRGSGELLIKLKRQFGDGRILNVKEFGLDQKVISSPGR